VIHLITATFGRTTVSYGAFHDPRKAERAREALEETRLFEEVLVETIPVYFAVHEWREKEYPEEAAASSEN
jgi:hypothetical protein